MSAKHPLLQPLTAEQFDRIRLLFAPFDDRVALQALLAGANPGRIFVDDVRQPRLGLALTVEGYLLAGDPDDPTGQDALQRFLRDKIFTGEIYVNGDWSLSLAVHPAGWEARLPALIPTHAVVKIPRYHYLCRAVQFDWRAHLPAGYTLRRADRALLADMAVTFPAALRDWFEPAEMWGSLDNFLAHGVGFCALHAGQVVAWCASDCAAGDCIDVGVITHPDHRRRGLAAVVVAATAEHCLTHGYRAVGWHCNVDNVASWKTAAKVGFQHHRDYNYYYYVYDPVDHLAELGWQHYQQGAYAETARAYAQVFARREDNPNYYYHLAALAAAELGESTQALAHLRAAAERGWAHAGWTREQTAFRRLHDAPEWAAILARMEQNAAT